MTTKATAGVGAVAMAVGLGGGYALRSTTEAPPAVFALFGDANWDGIVDNDDITTTIAHWGDRLEQSPWRGGRVYTEGGWTIGGENWCLVRVRGESEAVAAALGIPTGSVKYLSIRPDFTVAEGVEP
jgi:hypothetical protein